MRIRRIETALIVACTLLNSVPSNAQCTPVTCGIKVLYYVIEGGIILYTTSNLAQAKETKKENSGSTIKEKEVDASAAAYCMYFGACY
jgi:hypothetical protein